MNTIQVNSLATLHVGDCREVIPTLPGKSFHCCITSPPYFQLRDYKSPGQIGAEATPEGFVEAMLEVFGSKNNPQGVWRLLRDDGILWLNLGDSYGAPGVKTKDLTGIPWTVALALRDEGWYLRDAVVWWKPSPMPSSQKDRCTSSYEFVFQLTKSPVYHFDMEAVKEPAVYPGDDRGSRKDRTHEEGRPGSDGTPRKSAPNADTRIPRNVWKIASSGYKGAHFACYPLELCRIPILSSTSEKGCCPECGAPWQRLVERNRQPTRPGLNNCSDETGKANRDEQRHVTEAKTVGWEPGCDCVEQFGTGQASDEGGEQWDIGPFQPVPCTVLDPFAGSGTTLQFCTLNGIKSVGIELNPEYAELARKRINEKPGTPKGIESLPGQMSLFGGADGD